MESTDKPPYTPLERLWMELLVAHPESAQVLSEMGRRVAEIEAVAAGRYEYTPQGMLLALLHAKIAYGGCAQLGDELRALVNAHRAVMLSCVDASGALN